MPGSGWQDAHKNSTIRFSSVLPHLRLPDPRILNGILAGFPLILSHLCPHSPATQMSK